MTVRPETSSAIQTVKEKRPSQEHNDKNNRFDDLDDHLLTQLLTQIPWICAAQCKAVCKRWYSLINDSHSSYSFFTFILQLESSCIDRNYESVDDYNKYDSDDDIVVGSPRFFSPYSWYDSDSWYSSDTLPEKFYVLTEHPDLYAKINTSKCDVLPFLGQQLQNAHLVLSYENFIIWCKFPYYSEESTVYYLFDPLQTWSVKFPPPPFNTRFQYYMAFGFVLIREDNTVAQSNNTGSTSIDASPWRYMFVCVYDDYEHRKVKSFLIDIYCSETREWSKTKVSLPEGKMFSFSRNAVTCNDKLHWVDETYVLVYDPFAFGIGDECRLIELPSPELPGLATHSLGVREGHLWLSQLRDNHPYHTLTVWKLEDYDSGVWRLEHLTRLNRMKFVGHDQDRTRLEKISLESHGNEKVLAFHPFDRNILVLTYGGLVVQCNLRTRTIRLVTSNLDYEQNYFINFFSLFHTSTPSSFNPR